MAKAGRGQTRRDSKRRVLRSGESVRSDGKYQYKYHIDGKPHFVYSWKTGAYGQTSKGQETMPFPSRVGKTGKHRFRFACKYRRRTDDSL